MTNDKQNQYPPYAKRTAGRKGRWTFALEFPPKTDLASMATGASVKRREHPKDYKLTGAGEHRDPGTETTLASAREPMVEALVMVIRERLTGEERCVFECCPGRLGHKVPPGYGDRYILSRRCRRLQGRS